MRVSCKASTLDHEEKGMIKFTKEMCKTIKTALAKAEARKEQ